MKYTHKSFVLSLFALLMISHVAIIAFGVKFCAELRKGADEFVENSPCLDIDLQSTAELYLAVILALLAPIGKEDK